jgi:hypothetical protein
MGHRHLKRLSLASVQNGANLFYVLALIKSTCHFTTGRSLILNFSDDFSGFTSTKSDEDDHDAFYDSFGSSPGPKTPQTLDLSSWSSMEEYLSRFRSFEHFEMSNTAKWPIGSCVAEHGFGTRLAAARRRP